MTAIFYRVISFVMSFIFAIFGYGSLIGGTPITEVKVFDRSMDGFWGTADENYHIFYTYDEWKDFVEDLSNPAMKEFAEEYDEDIFKEHSLVLADIMLASSDWKVKVCSVSQDATTVEIDYLRVREDVIGFQAICFNTIFAVTEKYVAKVEFNEIDPMEIPFIAKESIPYFYSVVNIDSDEEPAEQFGSETHFFTDYASWKSFVDSGKWEFDGYADSVNEEYFEKNNLALLVMSHDAGCQLRISQPAEKDNIWQINYYRVFEPTVKPDILTLNAVFVETSKRVTNVEFINGGDFRIPYMLDGSVSAIYW
ncbi:MAG: hypothetical protein IJD49_10615 [Clostridia bacterium]|nr:hypothetical protein [Clostridia bacterium]